MVSAELLICVTPLATSPSAKAMPLAPDAALATLWEISPVAASCCSTEIATEGIDVLHALGDVADRRHRLAARVLYRENFLGDLFGGLRGLHGERFHFRSDDGETAPGLAGPRRLDCGIEREQIGLAGNVLNELDHVADFLRDIGERRDVVIGRRRVGSRAAHYIVGLAELAG
jgi:hypothetical protein